MDLTKLIGVSNTKKNGVTVDVEYYEDRYEKYSEAISQIDNGFDRSVCVGCLTMIAVRLDILAEVNSSIEAIPGVDYSVAEDIDQLINWLYTVLSTTKTYTSERGVLIEIVKDLLDLKMLSKANDSLLRMAVTPKELIRKWI